MSVREVVKRLDEELRRKGLRRGSQIYSANSTLVFNGLYESSKVQVAIKALWNLDQQTAARCRREAENQQILPQHPNVLELYDYFYFESDPGCYVLVLILQYVEKDLYQDITYRSRNSCPWSNDEIMQVAKDLISVLAMLQKQGIAHRDIKPQNLFIDYNQRVMLGDFGSSTSFSMMTSEYTIIGTPFYMSPELKKLLLDITSTNGIYSPIKSDVYSLGLSLLSMYKLAPPVTLADLATLQTATDQELTSITYQPLQALLGDMLRVKPEQRPDFRTLEEHLARPQSLHYTAPISVEFMECEHIAQGAQVYFTYPCHGRFCQACIPAVAFLSVIDSIVWYQITCPVCYSRYDFGTEEQFSQASRPAEESYAAATQTINSVESSSTPEDTTEFRIRDRRKTPPEEPTEAVETQVCLHCKQACRLSLSRKAVEEEVRLECGHCFCSRQCFLNFYEFASHGYTDLNVNCPSCSVPVSTSFAESILASPLPFSHEATSSPTLHRRICLTCRVNTATRVVHETHCYCTDCYTFLSQPKLYRCVGCEDCLSTMTAERPRKGRKSNMEVQEPVVSGWCCFKTVTYVERREEETDDGTVEILDSSTRSPRNKD